MNTAVTEPSGRSRRSGAGAAMDIRQGRTVINRSFSVFVNGQETNPT